jgi:tape measure domain-containing protein
MAEVATLKLGLDATGALRALESVTARLTGVGTKADAAGDAVTAFGADAAGAASKTTALGDSVGKAGDRARDARGRFVGAGNGAKEAGDKAKAGAAGFDVLGDKLKGVFAGLTIAVAVKESIQLADAYASMAARLQNAVGPIENFAGLQDALSEAAQRSRAPLEDITALYGRLAIATKDAGQSQADTLRVTEAITQAAIVSGATTQEASNAIRQLSQGFASGTLRGEELNSVLEQMPRLASAIAAGMGISVGELRKFGQEGKLTSDEVFAAILEQSGKINDEFATMPVTVGQAGTAFKNSLLEVLGVINQNVGATNALSGLIVALGKNLRGFASFMVTVGSVITDIFARALVGIGTVFGLLSKLPGFGPDGAFAQGAKTADEWAQSLIRLSGRLDLAAEELLTFTPAVSAVAPAATNARTGLDKMGEGAELAAKKAAALKKALEDLPTAMGTNVFERNGGRAFGDALTGQVVEIVPIIDFKPLTDGPPVPIPVMPAESSVGPVKVWFQQLWEDVSANLGDVLLATFNRIAQRGKATLGDLFSGLQGLGIGGAAGGQIFGAAAILVDVFTAARERVKAAYRLVDDQLESLADTFQNFTRSFGDAGGQFTRELQRINQFVLETSEQIDAILTKTARRALAEAGGDAGAALASLREQQGDPARTRNFGPAIAQLEAYIAATDDLREAQRAATEAAREAQKQRAQEAREDLRVRFLAASGRSEEADALRRQIQLQRDIADAYREFGVVMGTVIAGMILQVNQLEEDARKAAEEADRNRTIAGLDIEIARASGNEAEATRIERELILAEVTDEVVRAKYEELWAIQDLTKAQQEAAEAAELLANQQMRSEDLEVRRLVATGKSIEAEELRFKLEQERELRRAEAELARGEITQEIYDTLVEILGLEANAFANRNNVPPGSTASASASTGRNTQVGPLQALASAQVADIDRVVGELTTIRIRSGQLVQLMTTLVRGGGILGAVNSGLQAGASQEQLINGNVVVS